MNRRALIVFAKLPVPGRVKTRLTALLTEVEAARLYEAFLLDALDQYQELPVDVRLYLSPPAQAVPEALSSRAATVVEQRGDGLGSRMQRAFVESFAEGYEQLVVIGTDHPSLPSAFIEQAFEALSEPLSVVLGPSEDGGYYLLGMNDFSPHLFQDMTYSHPDVFDETLSRAVDTEARVTVLPPWYDVDTPGALRRLLRDLRDPSVQAPRTRSYAATLQERYPQLAFEDAATRS